MYDHLLSNFRANDEQYYTIIKDSLHRADLSKVMEGLNVLGKIPWKINHLVLDIAWKCWENGIALGDIPSRVDYDIPPLPKANDYVDYKTLGDFFF